ncbi:AAA family ATPase [Nocardioides antri]|uniref:Chromosome partitioning protein n=1 Tax=Nocardioides antri TaxID=2607659 RepID=A0A5B1LYF3_9ACTN|nr:chromosome partitioning protein [Nocardioides antri]KAA1425693.1 chromosome partitioning protein [Nocardioides antri]
MIVTLLVSTGAAWESSALASLNEHPGVVVLKRCVDVDDLLATASAGQGEVAVLGAELAGLDAAVVDQLRQYGVRAVAVAQDDDVARARAHRIGIDAVVAADRVEDLVDAVVRGPGPALLEAPTVEAVAGLPPSAPPSGRVIAVWGPAGAPGRTTLATALAAELARRRMTTVLVDADPYGGAVAQQLGVLDEVSGLLSAARLVTGGSIDERFPTVQRRLSDHLRVVTGLPRADRWVEVRPGALTAIVERARSEAQVVIDTGFSLEQDPATDVGARPERNAMTLEALTAADEVLLVGAADPVGLARVARAIAEVHEVLPAPVLRLVVNRMRPSLGWREADVTSMLAGFGGNLGVHFLPDDQPAVDRALVAGRTLVEAGESPLTRAVASLVDAMAGRVAARR